MGRGKALIVLWDPSGEVSPLLDSAGFEPVCLGPSRTQEADPRWWSERVEELLERGEPGVLICTLPGSAGSSVHEVEPAEVARFFDAFKGVLFLLRAILPLMMALSGGSVYLVPPRRGDPVPPCILVPELFSRRAGA